jgi:hypothetical protein
MKKSKNPNKWYFDVLECNESGDLSLTLSDRPGGNEQIKGEELPQEILDKLSVLFNMTPWSEARVDFDSTGPWFIKTRMHRLYVIDSIKELGFNYHEVNYSELF